MSGIPEISLVVPVFNEELSITPFITRVAPILEAITPEWEVLFVNDGSRDHTWDCITKATALELRIRGLNLSRNYGKEIALSAGLDHTFGRAVIPMDVDLQDPPELICSMMDKWREGFDVVLAKRIDRSTDSVFKRVTANAFYRVIAKLSRIEIPSNVGDFRLLDHAVVAALRSFPERERFMKGIFASVGFRTTTLFYVREGRALGETKFNPMKLFNLALEGIISFSTVPLKIWTYVGCASAACALFYMFYLVARTLLFGIGVPGYASIVSIMLLFNGITLVGLGIQGEYIARIFSEVKARPLYLVRDQLNGPKSPRGTKIEGPVVRARVEKARSEAFEQ